MATIKKPSFGAYLLILIFPPGYFFSRKKTGAGIVSLILLLIALPLFLVFGIGVIVWFGNVIWAAWDLRYEVMNYHIDTQAQAIAEKIKGSSES